MPRGGGLEFGFSWGSSGGKRCSEEQPFRVLVVGDLGGRASRDLVRPLEEARVLRVGIDSLDDVVARVAPEVSVRHPNGQRLSVQFRSMEDFHPDALFGELEFFEPMRRLRQQLRDPVALAALAASQVAAGDQAESDERAIERLLGRPLERPEKGPLDAWLRQIVAPHVVSGPNPQQAQLAANANLLMTELMRGLLHDSSFQQMEALWRGVELLVRRLDEEDGAEIWILDATRAELAADLERGGGALKKHLAERKASGHEIGIIAAALSLGPGAADRQFAMGLGSIAMQAGTPVVADAAIDAWESITADDTRSWKAFRAEPEAQWLGLGLPGFLVRMPYGAKTDAIESFPFEEQSTPPRHSGYLWGRASLLIATLISQALREGQELQLDGLPVHAWSDGTDVQQTPCAEAWLDDTAMERWLTAGMIPLMAMRGRDSVRLARVQSVHGDGLAGL